MVLPLTNWTKFRYGFPGSQHHFFSLINAMPIKGNYILITNQVFTQFFNEIPSTTYKTKIFLHTTLLIKINKCNFSHSYRTKILILKGLMKPTFMINVVSITSYSQPLVTI